MEPARPPAPATPPLPICQICFDPCRPVFNPAAESSQAGTSDQLCLGMYLGDPVDEHLACLDCLTTFIERKIEDQSVRAFPMNCPQVRNAHWSIQAEVQADDCAFCHQCEYKLTDEDAARIFGNDKLESWVSRFLSTEYRLPLPPVYCAKISCAVALS